MINLPLSEGRQPGDRSQAAAEWVADPWRFASSQLPSLTRSVGVPLPQPDDLPPTAATVVRELREHPAGAHALAMFRDERR